ncbi:YrhA family protein [Metabacillus idriensis]|uniref:YrhA family protein n=1 Tax=Metabacillus idriensis TaxID=324768 RepID=UPI003D2E2363
MPKWKELLIEISRIEEKYGSSLRNPALDTEIQKLKENTQKELGNIHFFESYIKFLKKANGLDFNGLVVYGVDKILLEKEIDDNIDGFIETNLTWHENDWQKQYVFFGDSDTVWYCYDLNKGTWLELDKPSGTVIQSFDNFDSMFDDALETSLS